VNRVEREPRADEEAAVGASAALEHASHDRDPLAHPRETVAIAALRFGAAVVGDLELELVRGRSGRRPGVGGAGGLSVFVSSSWTMR
jgi:hypothetical protein